MSIGLRCPECDSSFFRRSALYWHLVYEHKLSRDEAFESAGQAQRDWDKENDNSPFTPQPVALKLAPIDSPRGSIDYGGKKTGEEWESAREESRYRSQWK